MFANKRHRLGGRRGMLLWIVTSILSVSTSTSYSQSDSTRNSMLREVVVTGTQHTEVIPSQKLTGRALHRLSSHSVADAIRYFSGIQIKDFGGIGGLKTIDIRSMGTHHTGVFYDGIQLGNAQNGQIDLGKFSLDNIEEVSLYNGQKSAIFQPAKDYGSAGTIYLKTRRPKFDSNRKNNLRALFRTGSFDLINPSILWEHKISNSISSSFNTEYTQASGRYKFRYRKLLPDGNIAWDTTATRQNGDIRAFRAEGGLFGYTGNTSWNAKAYFYDSEKGIPGAIVNNLWKRSQRQWDRNFFLQSSLQREVNRRYSYMINAKYAYDYMRYLNPDTTLMYIDNHFTQQELYLSIANRFSILPKWDVSLSSDFQWNTLEADLQDFVYPQRYTTLVALATSFEVWKLKGQISTLGTFVQEKSQRKKQVETSDLEPQSHAPNKQEYTPALFISYKPFDKADLNIRAFYKRIFRMPTFNDLYYTDIGNISLLPEYTSQYNIGAQYIKTWKRSVLHQMTLRTDAYYNEVTNKIIAVPKGNGQFRWMMMNLGYVEIRGLDATAQFVWTLPYDITLQTNANYTYQKAQDFSDPTDNDPTAGTWGKQIAYIPWHSCSFTLMANFKRWELNYCFIYVGERYHNSSNIRENHEQPWYTSDLSLSKEFQIKNTTCKITAEVNNLLNQYYDVVLNYPMPGRNFKFIFKINI